MNKPKKPEKVSLIPFDANYDFDWCSKKVSLEVFNEWCKEVVPDGATDVTLELKEDWEYDTCMTYLQVEWKEFHVNHLYEKQMKKYEKALTKWKKSQCQK